MTSELEALLALNHDLTLVWQAEHTEETRLKMRDSWEIHITCPGNEFRWGAFPGLRPEDGCQPTVLSRDDRGLAPDDMGDLWYKAACLGCGWVGVAEFDSENDAVEDALDHTHPGWRETPIIPACPRHYDLGGKAKGAAEAKRDARRDELAALFPDGWAERHGPNMVIRPSPGTRHVPGYGWWGGYEVCVTTPVWLWVESFSVWFGPFDPSVIEKETAEKERLYPGHRVQAIVDSPHVRRRVANDLARLEEPWK